MCNSLHIKLTVHYNDSVAHAEPLRCTDAAKKHPKPDSVLFMRLNETFVSYKFKDLPKVTFNVSFGLFFLKICSAVKRENVTLKLEH